MDLHDLFINCLYLCGIALCGYIITMMILTVIEKKRSIDLIHKAIETGQFKVVSNEDLKDLFEDEDKDNGQAE